MLHLLILAWPVLVPACFRICCRRPRTALGARPSRGQVRPGEEQASADVQMSCPRLLEEGQHGYILRPLARHRRRVRRYEGEREPPRQPRAQQRQALPLHLAWLPPGLRAAEPPHRTPPRPGSHGRQALQVHSRHRQVHEGVRVQACAAGPHRVCHNGEPRWQCPHAECGEWFNSSSAKSVHVRQAHQGTTWACPVVGCEKGSHSPAARA